MATLTSCDGTPATQVIVIVDADDEAVAGAAAISVRACPHHLAPTCEGGYFETRSLGDGVVAFPTRIPVGPPATLPTTFWLEARLLDDADQPTHTVRAIAGFVEGEVRSLRLRFEAACRDLPCDANSTCYEGSCVDACFETGPDGAPSPSAPVACTLSDGGVPIPSDAGPGCTCPCPGDTCVDGQCIPARPVELLAAGRTHTCAGRADDSTIHCWGENTSGQLGLGEDSVGLIQLEPLPVELASGIHRLSAGIDHTCAVLALGDAYCWGGNNLQRLGVEGGRRVEPTMIPPPETGSWASIALWANHTCGATTRSQLYCWGAAANGQIGALDPPLPDSRPTPIKLDDSWSAAAVGADFSCGLNPGGTVYCWGLNDRGQLAQPAATEAALRPVRVDVPRTLAIEAAQDHVCALLAETNELRCWGWGADGRLGNEIRPLPQPVRSPTPVVGDLEWRQFSLGQAHTCGITVDRHLFCWGSNLAGQLGMGDADRAVRTEPDEVMPSGGWEYVTTGTHHTCAVRDDGAVYCWGQATNGQLSASCRRDNVSTPCRVCLP
jgi:alpha-tubulin suppressor-like RCC1 family protein